MILKEAGIKISISGKISPYENAKMESFFRTLKVEEVYMSEYGTFEDVLNSITYFIEDMHNKKSYILPWGIRPRRNLNIDLIKITPISWF